MTNPFCIEKLEDRILLAGNITAIQNGSQLIMNGDAADNDIVVTNDGGAGTIKVLAFGGGTVNGGASDTFDGITDIVFRGRAGDDEIEVEFIEIAGNLTIQLNNGDGGFQDASIFGSEIGGNLAISSDGAAGSRALVDDSNIGGATRIATGAGEDEITLEETDIGGQLVINAGHGDNFVGFEGLGVGSNLVVVDGADDLLLAADEVEVGGTLNINAGARGDSEISLNFVDVGGQMWVRTGDGEDIVSIFEVEVDLGTVIALREGDDLLAVEDSTFHSHFQASGGPHDAGDAFLDGGGITFDVDPIITRFEIFP